MSDPASPSHSGSSGPASSSPSNSIANFFIARPIFAIVLAIAISLAGLIAILSLSISQYPQIAPIAIRINSTYPGATAEAVENSVTIKIEDAMTGLDGMLYMESTSATGQSTIAITFDNTVDPDFAQVQVQNKLARVQSRLPQPVQDQGVIVTRSSAGILMIGNIISTDRKYTSAQLADIVSSQIEDRIERVDGVGTIQSFASPYAMRIWLDPVALDKYELTPADVNAAISAQNVQVSAGAIGAIPVTKGAELNATIVAQTQMSTVDEFKTIRIKTATDGSVVRLQDVARVELGLQRYGRESTYNGLPASGFGVQLASGANAITTAEGVHAALDEMAKSLPPGVKIAYSYETTPFVILSIEKVVETLVEAIILVFIVLLIFLQNIRATLIPMVAVPVVLLGTFGILAAFGYSINMLTMFAMVLAIGLLVDDAIVVVENVERIMNEDGVSAPEATKKSMGEITSALIGVALVLTAVFIPMAFFSGSVGVIYRQFSVTIASAMILSVLVAIVLTPALCALMLKPSHGKGIARYMGWFNDGFEKTTKGYLHGTTYVIKRPLRAFVIFAVLLVGLYVIYQRLPTSFLPEEDQGVLITQITLPPGANVARTRAVAKSVQDYYLTKEKAAVEDVFMTTGFNFDGAGENAATAFVKLKDFSLRKDPRLSARAVARRATAFFRNLRDAQVFALAPPAIQGLGQSSGFTMYLEDTGNLGHKKLNDAANKLVDLTRNEPTLSNVRGNTRELESQLKVNIDQEKANVLGIDIGAANAVMSTAFAGTYVNDFVYNGQIKQVWTQGDAPFRMVPEDIYQWYVRNAGGEMVPFSAFTTTDWTQGPPTLQRFNSIEAVKISGAAAQGISSGTAMDTMAKLVDQLGGSYSPAWSDLSYQEILAGSQATILYAISMLVVFLCLAALYESWSIPFSVILAVPVGVLGALIGAWLFGQSNDVYFKVGLLTTIGLTAKNAILIVEFARELQAGGMTVMEAIREACRIRLRPIVMTSLAFILGVLPLAIATGASSGAQNSIGIAVMSGMIAATLLGIFFVPLLFVTIMWLSGATRREKKQAADHEPPADAAPSVT